MIDLSFPLLDHKVCEGALPDNPELSCNVCCKMFKSAGGLKYHLGKE
jgi:hypothetical protein